MTTAEHRKHIPIGVKLKACLLLLGFTDEQIDGDIRWDHQPALGLRFIDPETGEMIPHPNDPRFIRPMSDRGHHEKTFGRGGTRRITTAGSDIGNIAKVKRVVENPSGGEEFRRRLLAVKSGEEQPRKKDKRQKSRWPKRSFRRQPK